MNEINWTNDQWKLMENEIKSEVENSRLAHKIIGRKKELPPEARSFLRDTFDFANGTVDETDEKLVDLSETVILTREQTEDPDLGTAKLIIRRAAQRLARRHDQQVFVTSIRDPIAKGEPATQFHAVQVIAPTNGDGLVAAVAGAVGLVDDEGYRTGFVMIAGQNIYFTMHLRVNGAADLPKKAIEGLLEGGPIHRTAVLDPNEALVLSLSGEEIDRVVAREPKLEVRRILENDGRELRLYERFLPRFKQPRAAVLLRMPAQ